MQYTSDLQTITILSSLVNNQVAEVDEKELSQIHTCK